jgi:dTDP-glucose 4,6-dehydratase
MEIYGISKQDFLAEEDYGYLNHTSVRSSYSESKQLCECLCVSYHKEYDVPFKIARLTQTFGPGIEKNDNRVFAQFARSVMDKKDIVLFSKGETVRNYCYTADAVKGILIILLKGEDGQAYNIANEETEISIYDMAKMLAREYTNGAIEVKIQLEDEAKHGFNPVARTCIRCDKLHALGWRAEVGLKEAYGRMMESMKMG